jgi:magnesium-transporting ATPase (P-type)
MPEATGEYNPKEIEKEPVKDVLEELPTGPKSGLTEQEVQRRLEAYGQNAVEEERKNPVLEFLSYFWGPIPWMIEVVSHFRRAVIRIGYFLMAAAGVLVVSIVATSMLRGDPVIEVIIFALGLTMAGIPVALPAVLSVTMSIGAGRLAKWKAIVSRLASMEEMAGLSVLCADKTGTLTKNELELQDPVVLAARDKHDLIVTAALTVRREDDIEDPIDRAVPRHAS